MDRSRMEGGLWGLITGDALGVPVEFYSRRVLDKNPVTDMREHGSHNQPRGTWSDDSSMMIGAMDSLSTGYDPDGIMRNFARWMYDGEYTPWGKAFDVGRTCRKAIRFWQQYDYSALDAGMKDEHSNGNGSLMWILPVCYYALRQEETGKMKTDQSVDLVMKTSAITHAHRVSKMACGLYYFMIREIFREDRDGGRHTLQEIIGSGLHSGFAFYDKLGDDWDDAVSRYQRLRLTADFAKLPRRKIDSYGYVVPTLEAAVWCLLNTDSLKDALLAAVNLGDDTDTVATVTGGLAGTWYGIDAISEDWLSSLARKDWIEGMCGKFLDSLEN